MKRLYLLLIAGVVVLSGAGVLVGRALSAPEQAGQPKALSALAQQPIYGWEVCADLGLGDVPGVGLRQQFELCTGDGWRLRTYCIQPDLPAPAIGTICSQIDETTYWCGDGVQNLRELAVLATPPPAPAPTPTFTPTFTFTPLPTSTLTATPTAIPTATSTATFTPTPTSTATPLPNTPAGITATSTPRPRPGGQGNLEAVGQLAVAGWGILLAAFAGVALAGRVIAGRREKRP